MVMPPGGFCLGFGAEMCWKTHLKFFLPILLAQRYLTVYLPSVLKIFPLMRHIKRNQLKTEEKPLFVKCLLVRWHGWEGRGWWHASTGPCGSLLFCLRSFSFESLYPVTVSTVPHRTGRSGKKALARSVNASRLRSRAMSHPALHVQWPP